MPVRQALHKLWLFRVFYCVLFCTISGNYLIGSCYSFIEPNEIRKCNRTALQGHFNKYSSHRKREFTRFERWLKGIVGTAPKSMERFKQIKLKISETDIKTCTSATCVNLPCCLVLSISAHCDRCCCIHCVWWDNAVWECVNYHIVSHCQVQHQPFTRTLGLAKARSSFSFFLCST